MPNNPEILDVFSAKGEILYRTDKRAVSLLPIDVYLRCIVCVPFQNGLFQIAKRSAICVLPGLLDFCSGHVRSGELPFKTAQRELFKEYRVPYEYSEHMKPMYNESLPLELIARPDHKQYLVDIFFLNLPRDFVVTHSSPEVDRIIPMTFDELSARLINDPASFMAHPGRYLNQFLTKLSYLIGEPRSF